MEKVTHNLRAHTLSLADVVVTTVSNSGDAALLGFYNPHLIVVDEANRVTELDMCNILGNYDPATLLLIGDEKQLPPVVQSKREENGVGNLLHLSLFRRLVILDHTCVLLRVQYRMVDVISDMIFSRFPCGTLKMSSMQF